MIHKDLKSLIILLDGNLRARLWDFGLVRQKLYAPLSTLIGTPQWMTPKMLMKSPTKNKKADVFSFGIVLLELLISQIPY
jgi:serine/threonine protein kinase